MRSGERVDFECGVRGKVDLCIIFRKRMRFIEGDYLFNLQRRVRAQTRKGKTKERENHYQTNPPLACPVRLPKRKKAAKMKKKRDRRADSYTTDDAHTATQKTCMPATRDRNFRLPGLRLQSEAAEETSRLLLLLGFLSIGVRLVSRLCCSAILGVEGVLAARAVV